MRMWVKRFGMLIMAGAALAYLVLMWITGASPEREQYAKFEAHGVLRMAPESITRVTVTADGTSLVFIQKTKGWARENSAKVVAESLSKTLDLAVKYMHTANPVRVLKPKDISGFSPVEFGLDRPRLSITLENASGVVLEADFGKNSGDGFLQYMRLRDGSDLYMMSDFVGKEWEAVAKTGKP